MEGKVGDQSPPSRVVTQFEQILHTCVILRDFRPEEPALSEVEGI